MKLKPLIKRKINKKYEKTLNADGWLHWEDGPAYIDKTILVAPNSKIKNYNKYYLNLAYYFYLNGYKKGPKFWAKKTNHVFCKSCENFCKQKCFF